MENRKLLFSLISFAVALLLVVSVVFAWFIQYSHIDNIPLDVEKKLIEYYEIKFFKHNSTYKYDSRTGLLLMADGTAPNYNGTDEEGKEFNGIFMGKYDPVISNNNKYNNLIIELNLTYSVSSSTNITLSSVVKTSLASQAISIFEPNIDPSNIYYLSSYAYIQYMVSDQLITDNTYNTLTETFQNSIYVKKMFDESKSELILNDQLILDPLKNNLYIYINISYNEQKINNAFQTVWGTNPIIKSIYFFQDVSFVIKKKESL